jgi:hypothetical protein
MRGMKRPCHILFVGYMLMSATAASAAAVSDQTVFGIELGTRFSVPACGPGDGAFSSRRCFNSALVNHKAWGANEYYVTLPRAGIPPYVRGELRVSTVNGIVESVQIATWGFEAQKGALDSLTKKYGEPTRAGKKKQNKLRLRFPPLFAEWDLADFSVKFDGVTSTIDWGRIEVTTHRYRKLVEDHEKRQAAGSSP